MAAPDSWSETALVTLNIMDITGDFHMESMTESIDIDWGEKGFESIANLLGGRIRKFNPEEDTSITIEGYVIDAGFTEGSDATVNGVMNFLQGAVTVTNGVVSSIDSSHTRRKVRLSVRWTDQTGVNAEDALDKDNYNLRVVFADGYLTKATHSFTDKILKVTLTLKFPPFDKAGNSCVRASSTAGNAAGSDVAALAAYTSSNKF